MAPKRTSQFSALITQEERKILDAYCEQVDLPLARVISWLIRTYLKPQTSTEREQMRYFAYSDYKHQFGRIYHSGQKLPSQSWVLVGDRADYNEAIALLRHLNPAMIVESM